MSNTWISYIPHTLYRCGNLHYNWILMSCQQHIKCPTLPTVYIYWITQVIQRICRSKDETNVSPTSPKQMDWKARLMEIRIRACEPVNKLSKLSGCQWRSIVSVSRLARTRDIFRSAQQRKRRRAAWGKSIRGSNYVTTIGDSKMIQLCMRSLFVPRFVVIYRVVVIV